MEGVMTYKIGDVFGDPVNGDIKTIVEVHSNVPNTYKYMDMQWNALFKDYDMAKGPCGPVYGSYFHRLAKLSEFHPPGKQLKLKVGGLVTVVRGVAWDELWSEWTLLVKFQDGTEGEVDLQLEEWEEVGDKPAAVASCTCPYDNFRWGGAGCTCGFMKKKS